MGSIILKNISKVYPGGVQAVSEFDLEIKDQEFLVLVGPSGCGKSTVLRMIAGLEEITSGELYISDQLVNDVEPKERDIAMVFQNYALYPHMTVYKNLAFALKLRKMPQDEIDRKVRETAALLQLDELLDRKPKALSGGQKQRVALGRAMVRDPQAFLLDEPLSNLDAKLRASTRTEINKLHQELATTFVYVTHDQVEAMTMADRIVVMKDGRIHQVGAPQELYERPCNLFVAGFIGTPQMNFLSAVIRRQPEGYAVALDETLIPLPAGSFREDILAKYTDQPVTLGIRAEDVVEAHRQSPGTTLETTLEVREHMGSEILAYLDYKGSKIIAKVASEQDGFLRTNQKLNITFRPNRIHLFDPASEVSLKKRPESTP